MKDMLCPLCQERLSVSERHGIEIDVCPRCRGVWLDRGELDKVLERDAAFTRGARDHWRDRDDDDDRPRRRPSLWRELFD
jgi:uncharacterized protein